MRHPWDSQNFRIGAKNAGRSNQVIDRAIAAARRIKKKNRDLPVIFSIAHLAHLTDVNVETVLSFVDRTDDHYRIFRVKKRATPGNIAPTRRYRTICVPSPALKRVQRWVAQNILNLVEPHEASHAFAPHSDLVEAANKHLGCSWLVKLDIVSFFETISERQVYYIFRSLGYAALLSFQLARICTRTLRLTPKGRAGSDGRLPHESYMVGHLPQGAPTSPMLANLVARHLDEELAALAFSRGWTYTRYADDLTFSIDGKSSRGDAAEIMALATQALVRQGFASNKLKSKIIPPGARKLVLGIIVDTDQAKLSKKFRNNLETHLYALTSDKIGVRLHMQSRGFDSIVGMRKHIAGLLAFAHHVDEKYAAKLYGQFNNINWLT
ncbi:RNA-directed DNA polymerase [Rhizobium leguminosarum]|uniref:reverse transcriptase family protein n=1 Tax=Rhizobium leguminosarum TaxID=384 RepID=UPI001C8FE70B|nr:reverse transcriptase family protein [Rhizobium leguminosarum]MBY2940925.1 RNA-directed DNA polymerase [Rhizobium leguminosarum]